MKIRIARTLGLAVIFQLTVAGWVIAESAELARSLSKAFGDVYEKVSPSVVVIEVNQAVSQSLQSPSSPLMQFFFQDPDPFDAPPSMMPRSNQGSGFIITADGYILTNNHVLEGGAAEDVTVQLQDGRKYEAVIVGTDRASDLAVLKIDGQDLPTIEIGDSDVARVGEFAFAIGAPYDLRYTFTFGVIGAKGRTDITGSRSYEEYIQTDAAINPGNSGGPLVDIDGRVIGVNTLINGINRGLGFAIPINMAKKIAAQIIESGRFKRPWLGIEIQGIAENPMLRANFPGLDGGVFVSGVRPGTPASRSGLRESDVILKVDGVVVGTSRELQKAIFEKEIGDDVALEVLRNNRITQINLQTGEYSDGIIRAANPATFPQAIPMPGMVTGGLQLETLTDDMAVLLGMESGGGAVVTGVEPGSPAAIAQVEVGDVITGVGDKPVNSREEIVRELSRSNASSGVMLQITRGDDQTYAIISP